MGTDDETILQTFQNQFLIGLPSLRGGYFGDSISIIVEHDLQGAFGLVINQPAEQSLLDLFPDLPVDLNCPLLLGGPVEQNRLFFLHSPAPEQYRSSIEIAEDISMTASSDVIEALKAGQAPKQMIALLGYAGWGAEQLELEIQEDVWLLTPTSSGVVFNEPYAKRPQAAAKLLGIDLTLTAPKAGHD